MSNKSSIKELTTKELTALREKEKEEDNYQFFKESEISNLAYEISNYCKTYNPLLLEYHYNQDLIDLLSSFINFKNPFELENEPTDSDDEEYDDMNCY